MTISRGPFLDVWAPVVPLAEWSFTVALRMPPTQNHYWVRNVGRRDAVGQAGKEFRRSTSILVRRAMAAQNIRTFRSCVAIYCEAHFGPRRNNTNPPDVDNIEKALLDALERSGLVENDRLIRDLRVRDCGDAEIGYVQITVMEIE